MVVGGDGAWSRVQSLVTDEVPYFSGIGGLDMRISHADISRSNQVYRCRRGMCLTLGPNRAILSQRSGGSTLGGEGEVRTYAFVRMAVKDFWDMTGIAVGKDIDWSDMHTAVPAFMDRFSPSVAKGTRGVDSSIWDEGPRNVVLKADMDTAMLRSMWMLKPGLRWKTRSGYVSLFFYYLFLAYAFSIALSIIISISLFFI